MMAQGKRRFLVVVGFVVIAITVVGAAIVAPKAWRQWNRIQQVRRIIGFFDDSRLDESEAASFDVLLTAMPLDERHKLHDALERLVRGELVLEKTRTTRTGIPLLIVRKNGIGPYPAVLFMHAAGGMGIIGKETAIPYFALMGDRGYLMVAFDARHFGERGGIAQVARIGEQRIYPEIVIPTAWEDVFEVVEYLKSRADVAADRIGMVGYSMGGVIALGAGAKDTEHTIKAIVCAAGGADFHKVASIKETRGEHTVKLSPAVLDQIERFDPINHVDAFYPTALLLIHGRRDAIAPIEGVQSFATALRKYYEPAPERLELRTADAGHELYPGWVEDALDWFDKFLVLKPSSGNLQTRTSAASASTPVT